MQKEAWLDSRQQNRFVAKNKFDAKSHRLFSNLMVLERLEAILSDKKLQGIDDMGQLLLRIAKSPVSAAYIAIGARPLDMVARDALVRLCDAYTSQRDALRGEINLAKEDLHRAKTRPLTNPSFEDIENQKLKIKAINDKLTSYQREFDALPARNTLPVNLYDWPGKEDLVGMNLVTLDHEQAARMPGSDVSLLPFLTPEGKEICDRAVQLTLDIQYILQTGGQLSTSYITQLHYQAQDTFSECKS